VRNFVADRIEFQQGLKLFPLKTPTLPPATHTNCYLVGNRELLLFDPGAYDGVEQERLASFVERLRAEGYVPKAVVLTHHHADHVGSVEMLRSRFGLELWCHAETASRVGRAERLLVEGDRLVLNGEPEFVLEVLHTPGHARGHLCFFHRNSRALICGDMVAAQSTIIIDPPEGNLAHYLASLERLRALPPGTLYQAHGAPIAEGTAKLDEYLAHRRMRVEALYEALAKGPRTLSDLVAEVYADVPEVIHPIAERSALASLEYLIEQKRLRRSGERFERVDSNAV
jgi:glyoxylase-like metal-dependent hydrolase (beta-lactamase superfamily II)